MIHVKFARLLKDMEILMTSEPVLLETRLRVRKIRMLRNIYSFIAFSLI
jgi:hypothetical protein